MIILNVKDPPDLVSGQAIPINRDKLWPIKNQIIDT